MYYLKCGKNTEAKNPKVVKKLIKVQNRNLSKSKKLTDY